MWFRWPTTVGRSEGTGLSAQSFRGRSVRGQAATMYSWRSRAVGPSTPKSKDQTMAGAWPWAALIACFCGLTKLWVFCWGLGPFRIRFERRIQLYASRPCKCTTSYSNYYESIGGLGPWGLGVKSAPRSQTLHLSPLTLSQITNMQAELGIPSNTPTPLPSSCTRSIAT